MIIDISENIFTDKTFLSSYDIVLSNSEHYISILKNHLNALKNCNTILDLGCGSGVPTMKFLELGKDVTAVDISKASLDFLKNKALNKYSKQIRYIEDDMTELSSISSNHYGGVSSMIAAHLVENFENHIKESYRVLKNNGCFVITARDIRGNQKLLVDIAQKSLEDKGLMKDYIDDYNLVVNSLLMTANNRSKSLMTVFEAIQILENNGFVDIQELENKSQGVMYTLKAYKY